MSFMSSKENWPFPSLSFSQQPEEFRRQYKREQQRKRRAKLPPKAKKPRTRIDQLPRNELLAHRRRLRQQQRANARARKMSKDRQLAQIADGSQLGNEGQRSCKPVCLPTKVLETRLKTEPRPSNPAEPAVNDLQPLDPEQSTVYEDILGQPILQIITAQGKRRGRRHKHLESLEKEGKSIFGPLWTSFVAASGAVKKSAQGTAGSNAGSTTGSTSVKGRLNLNPAFGLWHSPGYSTFGFTCLSKKFRDLTIRLLLWAKRYTTAVLRRQKIHSIFAQKLRALGKIRQHLRSHFGKDIDLLHLFWSTLFLFKDATGNAHIDTSDDHPSLLFNFGGEAWLALPDSGVKLKLRPLDVAILASNRHKHYTLVEDSELGKRWAMGAFMRLSILRKVPLHTFSQERKAFFSASRKRMTNF